MIIVLALVSLTSIRSLEGSIALESLSSLELLASWAPIEPGSIVLYYTPRLTMFYRL
jgi:hypothetical protein